jgi:hypothetical protein
MLYGSLPESVPQFKHLTYAEYVSARGLTPDPSLLQPSAE